MIDSPAGVPRRLNVKACLYPKINRVENISTPTDHNCSAQTRNQFSQSVCRSCEGAAGAEITCETFAAADAPDLAGAGRE